MKVFNFTRLVLAVPVASTSLAHSQSDTAKTDGSN